MKIEDVALMNRWASLHIENIEADTELPGTLFLFIGGKFLEFKQKGDFIPSEKHELFILKKLPYFFIKLADINIYNEWIERIRKNTCNDITVIAGNENKELITIKQNIKHYMTEFFSGGADEKLLSNITWETRSFAKIVGERPVADVGLVKMSTQAKNIIEHSINVAILSVYLAHHLGLKQQLILETAFLGGLLHDFGKTFIDASLYDEGNAQMLENALKDHPNQGRDALKNLKGISEEVLRIIEEHHENVDGSGHPLAKKGQLIYDLTKIVSIANAFDNFIRSGQGSLKERSIAAVNALERDKNHRFDPQKLPKAIRALRLGIKE
ncbi:MAG: HD domain-containing protein [Oligoflexia bacterium]|nr:HD domain-containing protein [Oligoflexia bacterium]MBF0367354.1 HD domain-containing protein [Oligoflexia bacterium]